MTMVNRFKYYFNPIILSISCICYGFMLFINRGITIQGVDLFERPQDTIMGLWMFTFGVIKIISLFIGPRKLKKWAMIGVMVGWAIVSWAYLTNPIQNLGYVLTITLTILSGAELYRGDFIERKP